MLPWSIFLPMHGRHATCRQRNPVIVVTRQLSVRLQGGVPKRGSLEHWPLLPLIVQPGSELSLAGRVLVLSSANHFAPARHPRPAAGGEWPRDIGRALANIEIGAKPP